MTKILTQRALDAAKPPKTGRLTLIDGIVPGLRVVVHPTGKKTCRLLARHNGRQQNHDIGNARVMTLAELRTKGKGILATIANGGDPKAMKQDAVQAAAKTVEIVARDFIERYAKVHNKAWRDAEWRIEREILPHWGKRPIRSITKLDVVALLDGIVDRGVAVSANRALAAGRKMFNWARERSLIDTSPFDHIEKPAPETKRDRKLDEFELRLILRAIDRFDYPFGPFLRIALLTGQRREECAGMRWSELSPDLTEWTLPRARVKNNEPHAVPLAPWARATLAALPRIEHCDFVFTTTGKRPISGFSKAKAALDAIITELNGGVPLRPWRLHDFRRSMASHMARLGVQLPTIEKVLNHVSGSFGGIVGVYQQHDYADEKAAALETWAQYLLSLDAR
jgi:integrase